MRALFIIAAAVASLAAGPGAAQTPAAPRQPEVSLQIDGGPQGERREALRQRLEQSSATLTALEAAEAAEEGTEPLTAQDLFGSALSDYRNLLGALYAEGYYGPEISIAVNGREAADIDPFRIPARIDSITIAVEPGPRFFFRQTEVAPRAPGATADPIVEGFAPGRPAKSERVGAAANAGVREWREAGHAKAAVDDQQVVADHPARQLDVDIDLAPGPRLRFGRLDVQGDTSVSDKRVRAIMGYPRGEVYSPQELRDAVTRLRRAGVWSTVTVAQAETPNPDGTIDYRMTLIDEEPRRFGFSAEFSTLDGLTIGGFWLHRNLFGGAERLRIDAEAANIGGDETGFGDEGGADFSLGARITRPGSVAPDTDAFAFAEFEDTNDPEFDETAFTFGIGLTRYFSDNLTGRISSGLRYSDVSDAFGSREFYHAVFPSEIEWDRRDSIGDPKRGFYLRADAMPYAGLDATSQSGLMTEVDARSYLSFGAEDGTTFAGRLQLGNIFGSDIDATPPDFLFFSGGGDTVRGHSFQSLGIEQPSGRESGGRSFLGASFEIRQAVTDSIGVVAFADVGYIDADSVISEDAESHSGVGLGLRYGTPIGPIRVDVATPYTDSEGDEDRFASYELYIGVGQAF